MKRRPLTKNSVMFVAAVLGAFVTIARPPGAGAFCGFYVGKADSSLHNRSSRVVLARDGDHTVISIMSDYQGPLAQFAMVVPVPVVLERGQIHVGDSAVFKHLGDYSAPRLVQYDDPDPCETERVEPLAMAAGAPAAQNAAKAAQPADALGVTVEASYTVGEYDIVILSAMQSDGLATWLKREGYVMPAGAATALEPYIRTGMKFFVARVNLKAQAATGLDYLRPIQFAFDSPKFMLPIRLGMVNSVGSQDLIIFMLTRSGRVETTNYRTVPMTTGTDVPDFVRDDFTRVYEAAFAHQAAANDGRALFTEYVWNMGWCDPCAAPPLSRDELRELGVFWLSDAAAPAPQPGPMMFWRGPNTTSSTDVILTRLHVRYTADKFPEDLMFQQTGDTDNFQTRYVIHRPWQGSADQCPAAKAYLAGLDQQRAADAGNLADLTGWNRDSIARRMGIAPPAPDQPWWSDLWGSGRS